MADTSAAYYNYLHLQTQEMSDEERARVSERMAAAFEKLSPEVREQAEKEGERRRAREEVSPKVGDGAPDFELATLDGSQRVRLSSLRGQPVGLIFGSYT